MTTTTMTIRVDTEIKDALDSLAHDTQRSRSFLAAEAVTRYVQRERAIVEGVKKARADFAAGRTVAHDDAIAQLRAVVDDVATPKAR
jgi:predicted transcriptional regulator